MIYLDIDSHDFENDIRVMTLAFYLGERIVTEHSDDARYLLCIRVGSLEGGYAGYVRAEGLEHSFERTPGGDHKAIRNDLKRTLYGIFSTLTGKILPWGTLTGIRPCKIPLSLIEQGLDMDAIIRHMRDEYLASPAKVRISYDVAATENRVLAGIDYANEYSLYVGIPFCPTTCLYCSFTSYYIGAWKDRVDEYLDALIKELKYIAERNTGRKLTSIYLGGGTPTTLEGPQLERLLTFINEHFDISDIRERCVEAGRPDSITREKLLAIKSCGFERISINPQTMNDKTLRLIGRQHDSRQVEEAFYMARDCGFPDINMDLIVGLPGEGLEELQVTLDKVEEFAPENLTIHSLAVKRAARLNTSYEESIYKPLTDISHMAESDTFMTYAEERADAMGYIPYYLYRQKNMAGNLENVGYAKPGKEGIYNIAIMEEKQTIWAAGAGAQSKIVFPGDRVERCENVKNVEDYITRVDEMIERKAAFLE